jgi:two-component system response regulator DevR
MSLRPSSDPIRLLLVDDSVLVRQGIKAVLLAAKPRPSITVVGEEGTAAGAVAAAQALRPDIVLLDLRLPDQSGFVACREIVQKLPDTRVLVLTSFANDDFVGEAIASGAQGYLMKELDAGALVRAIHDIAEGKSILAPSVTAGVLRLMRGDGPPVRDSRLVERLSAQQHRVLAAVAAGKTNKEIGVELGLSDNTVKNYLAATFDKLRVKRRSQATAVYLRAQSVGTSSALLTPD